ncbi:hypothetical protein [Solibacillus sp. NPDC093137]|uniref:hypothetical protein n=1 Tax=Solibacillus sp. NPDC093137 TaxID=3390678 RepID=UPI003D066F70
MPKVMVKGVFMGANLKKSQFDGKETTSLYIDVYQPESNDTDKMVQVKSKDVTLIQTLNNDYTMGSIFEAEVSVNAYQNKAYFNLLEIIA